MIRYKQFQANDTTEPEQRTLVIETVLYDEDGSEIVTNSRKTTVAQEREKYAAAPGKISAAVREADDIATDIATIKGKLKLDVVIPDALSKKFTAKQKTSLGMEG